MNESTISHEQHHLVLSVTVNVIVTLAIPAGESMVFSTLYDTISGLAADRIRVGGLTSNDIESARLLEIQTP